MKKVIATFQPKILTFFLAIASFTSTVAIL